MVRELLIRGMLVGLLAGSLVFAFARIFGEPQVETAIAFETALNNAKMKADLAKGVHDEPQPELVSRAVQASLGLLTGVMVYATAFGGLFALVFAFAYGRIALLGPRPLSALLAVLGFISLYLVPNLKYPANPPSIGIADTIGIRTALYFSMMASSVVAMVGAVYLRKRLARNYSSWNAALIASAAYLAIVILVAAVFPPVNEVPRNFPAVGLWRFRIDSIAMQAIMWATFGLVFGALTENSSIGRLYQVSGYPSANWR